MRFGPRPSWFTLAGLLLALATLTDSWVVDRVHFVASVPGCQTDSVPKHEILVVRRQVRGEARRASAAARPDGSARRPHRLPAAASRIARPGLLLDAPTPVDPAAWLGPRHLRSPS